MKQILFSESGVEIQVSELGHTCYQGSLEEIQVLISKANWVMEGSHPLICAMRRNSTTEDRIKVLGTLLKAGAIVKPVAFLAIEWFGGSDISYDLLPDPIINTAEDVRQLDIALNCAAQKQHFVHLKRLLSIGADPTAHSPYSQNGNTALHFVCANNDLESLSWILEKRQNADVRVRNFLGQTPLELLNATSLDMRALLEERSRLNEQDDSIALLHYALMSF